LLTHAELYQYDCWSALKYVNDTQQVADAMAFLINLANVTNGATTMVATRRRHLALGPIADREGWVLARHRLSVTK
ncbi:unnamed protein product, partial [Musa hybrid cultivar]